MKLEKIPKRKKRRYVGKRVGRGYGSGVGGHTSGRGEKGQKSRSGHKSMALFAGGDRPFHRKTPKYRGFKKKDKVVYTAVNLSDLDRCFKSGEKVNIDTLKEKKLIGKRDSSVKILGKGQLNKKIVVQSIQTSQSAREAIEKAGGELE